MRKPELKLTKPAWIAGAACIATLPVASLFAGTGGYGSPGSGAPSGVAEQEIIKRLQRIENARQAEADGDRLMADGDYDGARQKYQEALLGIPNAPMSASDRSRIIAKFANASVKQADKLGKMGKFSEAKALLEAVLADDIDPGNVQAKTLLKRLDDPDYYNPAMTETHYKDTEEVKRLFKMGLGYYDLGQYNLAEEQFNKVLSIDPHNVSARRLLEKTEREIDNYLVSARDHTRQKMIREVNQLWETAVPKSVPIPTSTGPTAKVETAPILLKLRNTKLPRLQFDQASIDDVITYLRTKSMELDQLDANKTGVNFILQTSGKPTQPVTLDLREITLETAVQQVVQLAGLRYRVESHGVIISDQAIDKLETRVFAVPPNFLSMAGDLGGGGAGGDAAADPFAAEEKDKAGGSALKGKADAKTVLTSMGANFERPQSNAIFLPGSSRLVVTNTLEQLDLIEKLIEDSKKNVTKQVHITCKFVEVTQRNTEELGFDWLIGAFNVGGGRAFGSGGTTGNTGQLRPTDYPFIDPSSGANPTPTGQNSVTSSLRSGTAAITQNAIDSLLARQILTADISTKAPGVFALAGVFTDPQFQMVMRALAQKKGVDLLTAPSIVTRSGQRAKIEIIREFPYPTDFDPPQIPQDFGNNQLNGGGGFPGIPGAAAQPTAINSFPVTPTTPTTFEVRNTGVSMEVDPVVAEDGYTIDLNLAPEVVEFEGFINYGSPINTGAINALGVPTTVVLTENRIEQPVFATRKLNTAVTIWDQQTVGIGGLIREDVQMVEDKVPILGDVPLLGRLFRSKSEEHFKKNLMIYVTARLIDPAGRDIHSPTATAGSPDMSGAPGDGDASSPLLPPPSGEAPPIP
ncbi:MAG: tetratricopeptide repeat protein [Verrucomicrobiales bacterium]|nr:tetratricopeptide repeat protein [Verrucomicrobiales bacterium]